MSPPSTYQTTDIEAGATFRRSHATPGFTLVEMMVAVAILLLIMLLVTSLTDQVGKAWKRSNSQIESFESARAAYETMTMQLRQATLNTYLDYYDSSGNVRTAATASSFVPSQYARASDLHFVIDQASSIVPGSAPLHPTQAVFFVAPLGFTETSSSYGNLPNALNACGFYVEFNSDSLPPFLSGGTVQPRYRYRLMEFLQPTESLAIYTNPTASGGPPPYDGWFYNFLPSPSVPSSSAPVRMLAENIIALVILAEPSPHDSNPTPLTPNYTYDTRAGTITTPAHDQLPPLLRVVMVAIDEPSALRLNPPGSTTPPTVISSLLSGATPLFQTASLLDQDLNTLGQALSNNKITYRVFDTDIALRGSHWSVR